MDFNLGRTKYFTMTYLVHKHQSSRSDILWTIRPQNALAARVTSTVDEEADR